jgi:hypothetical protein
MMPHEDEDNFEDEDSFDEEEEEEGVDPLEEHDKRFQQTNKGCK